MSTSILLADDHTMFREALIAFLETKPELQLVGQVTNGLDAWEAIQTLRPDVTVVDITMPGISGLEVASKNTDAGYLTRIVVLTMHNDHRLALEAREAGAEGFVLKENTLEELVTAIDTVMAGGSFVSPSLRGVLRGLRNNKQATVLLSAREREVITLIANGNSSKEIAREMDISPRTVDTYRKRLAEKLGVGSLAEMVRYAVRVGLVG
jgi:DNA-binding NarL/FixJ family response regulator